MEIPAGKEEEKIEEGDEYPALDDITEMIFTPFKCGAGLTRARAGLSRWRAWNRSEEKIDELREHIAYIRSARRARCGCAADERVRRVYANAGECRDCHRRRRRARA